jgi:hypothetical protein
MGAGNILSLLFEISADPSKAQEAIDAFEKSSGDALKKAATGTKQLDDALLSNQNSVRLLSAELGIHLPRAVTGAIGQMLPEIAGLGTALLGVFAIEEAVKFVGWVHKLADEFNLVAESEKLMKAAADENIAAMEAMAKSSADYTRSQLALLNAQIVAGEANRDALKDVEEGLVAGNFAAGVLAQNYYLLTGHSKELEQAESTLNQEYKLRDSLVKILGEDEAKSHEKAAEAAKHAAAEANRRSREESDFIIRVTEEGDRSVKRMQTWHAEWAKSIGLPEAAKFSLQEINRELNQNGLAAAAALPPLTALSGGYRELTEAQRAALPLGAEINDALLRQAQHIHEVVAEMENQELPARRRIENEYQKQVDAANREIAARRNEYQQGKIYRAQMEADEHAYTQTMVDLAKQRKKAEEDESQAQRKAYEDKIGGIVDQIAALTGNTKAAAEIRGGYDAALAIEYWAKFIASYGTDVDAGLAATQYSLAAAEMFKIAGKSGPGGGGGAGYAGGAGGVGGRFATPSGGAYGGGAELGGGETNRALAGSSLAPGAAGASGGRVSVYLFTDSVELGRSMATHINRYVTSGGGELTASRALRPTPAQG